MKKSALTMADLTGMKVRLGYSIGSVLFVVLITTGLLFDTGWAWWVCWLVAVNVVAFSLYGWDKRRSQKTGFRIPEATLHTLAVTGGSPGALAGQQLFRHKTRKREFQIVFWLTVAAQAVVLTWFLAGSPTG